MLSELEASEKMTQAQELGHGSLWKIQHPKVTTLVSSSYRLSLIPFRCFNLKIKVK